MDPVFDCGARCGGKIVDLRIADCHVGVGVWIKGRIQLLRLITIGK